MNTSREVMVKLVEKGWEPQPISMVSRARKPKRPSPTIGTFPGFRSYYSIGTTPIHYSASLFLPLDQHDIALFDQIVLSLGSNASLFFRFAETIKAE